MTQSPGQEIQDRLAEVLPGLGAASQAVGLQAHRNTLQDHARRVRDGHRAQMIAAGFTPPPEDDMPGGDINICGDITYRQPPSAPSALSSIARAGIAAALLGSGAAIPLAIQWLTHRSQVPIPASPAGPSDSLGNEYDLKLVQ